MAQSSLTPDMVYQVLKKFDAGAVFVGDVIGGEVMVGGYFNLAELAAALNKAQVEVPSE